MQSQRRDVLPATMLALILALGVTLTGCSSQLAPADLARVTSEHLGQLTDPDADGVIDDRERCDETYGGALIDNYGCGEERLLQVPLEFEVRFANDSTEVTTEWMPELEEIALYLQDHPDTRLLLQGHASQVGSAKRNEWLAQTRAESVRLLLVEEFNVQPERLSVVGHGANKPLVIGDTEQAHSFNRRVVTYAETSKRQADMRWEIYGYGEPVTLER